MHHFEDFKGFARAKLDLMEPLTVLIGPNGSGKSNVIEAVELLSFIAQGHPLHEIVDVGRSGSGGLEIRGGLASCPRHGKESFSLGFSARIKFEGDTKRFEYWVKVRPLPHPRIVEEKLYFSHQTMIFETVGGEEPAASGDVRVRYNNFARGGKKPQVPVAASRSVLSQYAEFAQTNKKYRACLRVVQGLMRHLRASFVFNPVPGLMRSYERVSTAQLLRDGSNISAVLYALTKGKKDHSETLDRLLKWIRQLPEEPYQDFDFVHTKLDDVILGFKEGGNGTRFVDARLLSDGTLRSLAVLTALETVEEGSRVVIEEFDNGLHPSRVRILTEALETCCKTRKLNVLVTTHNPATLDSLQPDQIKRVVMCVWDKELGAFNLVTLADLPQYPEILERGRLGDLVTRRIVEQYLSPDFEKARKQEALEWLKSLE